MENTFDIEKYKWEFWLVTALFILVVLNMLKMATETGYWSSPSINSIESYNTNNFFPRLSKYLSLYLAYTWAHFLIVKKFLKARGDSLAQNILLAALPFTAVIIIWTLTDIWTQHSFYYFFKDIQFNIGTGLKLATRNFLKLCGITGVYVLYTYLKYDTYFITTIQNLSAAVKRVLRDCFWLLAVWFIIFRLLISADVLENIILIWLLAILPGIFLYAYTSISLIPQIKKNNKGYWYYWCRVALIGLVVLLSFYTFFLVLHGLQQQQTVIFTIIFLYILFQLCITTPLTWAIFHYRLKRTTEITGLKTALGQSSASLDFLRSQINPHFLFNALNTLYGTAIQENANRTGEGIQKLGDMMRFMLHENTQEKISLMREVDYLNNYIDLQRLRTHASPDIAIQTEIEESINGLQIAPMLLIPFVENAFKHGISLREASYIKITLHTNGNKLFFDVHNSIHQKTGADPEKHNTGIGLENVKQRLQMLYPDQHELMIRQTGKEYFAHLTVELK